MALFVIRFNCYILKSCSCKIFLNKTIEIIPTFHFSHLSTASFSFLWIILTNVPMLWANVCIFLNQLEKLEAAKGAYLWLPSLTFGYLTFPYPTFGYLTLPLVNLPYLSLPSLSFPFLSLRLRKVLREHSSIVKLRQGTGMARDGP